MGHTDVVIATDADLAGHVAAERDYWQLTPHGIDPRRAVFPEGTDPADLLTTQGPTALAATLDAASPMAHVMIDERTTNLPEGQAADHAAQIVAARPPQHWDTDTEMIADRLQTPVDTVRDALARHTRTWNQDPRQAATRIMFTSTDVRRRLEAANRANRWTEIVNNVDPRLTSQPEWPALARTIQQAHEAGYDAEKAVRLLARPDQASPRPAAELRARIAATLNLTEEPGRPASPTGTRNRDTRTITGTRRPAPSAARR